MKPIEANCFRSFVLGIPLLIFSMWRDKIAFCDVSFHYVIQISRLAYTLIVLKTPSPLPPVARATPGI